MTMTQSLIQTITTIFHIISLTLFFELTSAPLSRSNLTTSVWPLEAAKWRAVNPLWYEMKIKSLRYHLCEQSWQYLIWLTIHVFILTSAPLLRSNITTSMRPNVAAWKRAVAPHWYHMKVNETIRFFFYATFANLRRLIATVRHRQ